VKPAIEKVRLLEGIGADAWPAATTIRLDGWRLGLDRGVTRRANSVLPNARRPIDDPEALIDQVERHYRAHGLAPCFKMTIAAQPSDLDRRLERRGYTAEGHSLVLVSDIGSTVRPPLANIAITLHLNPSGIWLDTCWPQGRTDHRDALEQIALRVPFPRTFGLARLDGVAAGAALAIASDRWVGLTAVHTVPARRRRGVAHSLLNALTDWAIAQAATHFYLQVEADNIAARRLYGTLGFAEIYRYHYRRLAA